MSLATKIAQNLWIAPIGCDIFEEVETLAREEKENTNPKDVADK